MSKQTSILNFFSKSPAVSKSPLSNLSSNVSNNALSASKDTKPKPAVNKQPKFEIYDIVWARLDGYPHWPALICNHPSGSFFKTTKSVEYLNCQFFDNPPVRAWIRVNDCIQLVDGTHPKLKNINDERLEQSIVWALEAMEKGKPDRAQLVLLLNSDESDAEMSSDNELSPLNKSSRISKNGCKRKYESDSEREDDRLQSTLKKKKKTFFVDSDDEGSADEFKPSKFEIDDASSTEDSKQLSDELSDIESLDNEDESMDSFVVTPVKRSTKKSNGRSTSKKSKSNGFDKENSSANAGESCISVVRKFSHETYDFIKPENIRDKDGRRPEHPDYDPKTLYVPNDWLKKQTQTQQQWWLIKRDHFDTILFFKMGKFYELYHMDAVLICELTNIIYMKGQFAHAGFPEKAYQRFADILIEKGHQVARIEQTESADARDKRCKESSNKNKVVSRELCRITSRATKSLNEIPSCVDNAYSSYLLAITEKEMTDNQILTGLCFIDTSIGKFHVGQLVDDKYSTLLRTIFAHYPPAELILEKDHITGQTLQTIKSCLPNVMITYFKTDSEFLKPRETLLLLMEGPYFKEKTSENKMETKLPPKLQDLLDPSDPLNLTVKKEFELALKSMGAIIFRLKRNLIEEELLSKKDFNIFDTNFLLSNTKNEKKDFMILDSVTIKNLELFENSAGGKEGTLLQIIDTCMTKFGKRRLRQWICSPLCSKKEIDDRLSAIGELLNLSSLNDLHQDLKQLPDLERILLKIHTHSLPNRFRNHPDSRAVFMEAESPHKAKVGEFCKLIESFNRCDRFVGELRGLIEKSGSKSQFLTRLITYKEDGGIFPNTVETLKYFENSFDHRAAKEKGMIQPKKGVNKEFEKAEENIKTVHQQLNQHLKDLCIKFGEKLQYIGKGKNRFQIEFPVRLANKIDKDFEITSQRKGFNRYRSRRVKDLLVELKTYETDKEEAMQESWRIILHAFMEHSDDFDAMIKIVAVIDCLISLTNYANSLKSSGTVCRPTILLEEENENKNVIRYKGGQHPSLVRLVDNFMSNDLALDERLLLLTGPNMAGKSTLMRQTGLLTLLAHIGSFVPAELFECTLVDRIFTRLGATDRILEGESTFYVELSETSTIIKHATNKSLVLLDELGRGTSSIDGTSIACSVVDYISNKIKCPTMFSTHYNSLVEEFKLANNIMFGHMGCIVENEDFKDPTNETITFLYKLAEGVCPKSYGFNAAKLSGVPDHVVREGFNKAKELESSAETIKLLSKLVSKSMNIREARLLINYLIS